MPTAPSHRPGPRRARFALVLLAATAAAGCGDGALAPGEEVLLRWGDDVLGAGPAVTVTDSIVGDAMLAGGELSFSGTLGGSYLGAGQAQRIDGRIAGSVRAAGGSVRLQADVGRNATMAGGVVLVEEDATIGGSAYLAGGRVEVLGEVLGSVRTGAGEVVIDGPVAGDVHVEAGSLRLGPAARIGGGLTYRLEEGAYSADPSAEIQGTVEALPPRPDGDGGTVLRVLRVLAFVLTGAVAVALLPGPAAAAAHAVRHRALVSLGLGLLWLVGVPLVILLVGVTVLGIPLAMIVAAVYAVTLYLGPVAPALWLGDRLLPRKPGRGRLGSAAAFAAGGAVLAILGLVPAVGILVRLLVTLAGMGAAGLVVRDWFVEPSSS